MLVLTEHEVNHRVRAKHAREKGGGLFYEVAHPNIKRQCSQFWFYLPANRRETPRGFPAPAPATVKANGARTFREIRSFPRRRVRPHYITLICRYLFLSEATYSKCVQT